MFNLRSIPRVISILTILVGITVIIGWIFDISILKSVIPNAVTMKFSTAVSFVFSGILLYFVSNHSAGRIGIGQIAIPISGLVVFLFMASLLVTSIFGISSGIERLFVSESRSTISTTSPGAPSVVTTISFLLIIIVGILSLNNIKNLRPSSYIGKFLIGIGIISLIGHITSQPLLYYYVKNVSTAMAIHTSILFTLIGFALIMMKPPEKIVYSAVKIQTKLICLFLASSIIPIVFIVGLNFTQISDASQYGVIIISIVTAISVGIFSILTAKAVSRPIIELNDITRKISNGDLTLKADESFNDEIGDLSKSFNHMLENVIKAERLSTIGLLASKLGHDLRNNLTSIKISSEMMRNNKQISLNENLKRQIAIIERSTSKINDQIEDVLNFVRTSPLKSEQVPISRILRSMIETIKIPPKIKLVLPKSDILVTCGASQFEVILTNLLNNSIQAIESEGEIIINAYEDGNSSVVEIKDSGHGIPEKSIQQIFEPLFTTKQKGTGLGLATCKNIVEQYGGTINVKNHPTTFTIKFPK